MEWLIIDGFSLLHRDATCAAVLNAGRIWEARRRLVQRVAAVAGALAGRVTVVFDGRGSGGPEEDAPDPGIEVLYSPAHQTADTVIERLVWNAANPASVCVVTSDRLEREAVAGARAMSLSCGDFLKMLSETETNLRRKAGHLARRPAPGWRNALGDRWGPE